MYYNCVVIVHCIDCIKAYWVLLSNYKDISTNSSQSQKIYYVRMPINKALQGERTLVEPVYIWHLPQKKGLSQVSRGNQKHSFGIA